MDLNLLVLTLDMTFAALVGSDPIFRQPGRIQTRADKLMDISHANRLMYGRFECCTIACTLT